ncbi:hypothetical protein ACOSP7_032644 [Xanthoceras sorbifolium]
MGQCESITSSSSEPAAAITNRNSWTFGRHRRLVEAVAEMGGLEKACPETVQVLMETKAKVEAEAEAESATTSSTHDDKTKPDETPEVYVINDHLLHLWSILEYSPGSSRTQNMSRAPAQLCPSQTPDDLCEIYDQTWSILIYSPGSSETKHMSRAPSSKAHPDDLCEIYDQLWSILKHSPETKYMSHNSKHVP